LVKVIGFMAFILLIIITVLASTESWLEGNGAQLFVGNSRD